MWKPILTFTGIYLTLFFSHILSGSNGYDMLFNAIVVAITTQTMFAGFFLYLLGGDPRHARFPLLGLSAGLGWAYADMNIEFSILIWVVIAIFFQILTEKGLKYVSLTEGNNGRHSNTDE
tara:strand:- start:1125 stop:1484 length:360 start_codon:yes stop_codon:yes gene_type:complete